MEDIERKIDEIVEVMRNMRDHIAELENQLDGYMGEEVEVKYEEPREFNIERKPV